jgi:uncharacterized protein YndB with AHSA1/START domain
MWKWVVGSLVVVVVAVACLAWWGIRKYETFTADGGTATVTIAASPTRVFASLANADSLTTWRLGNVSASHHGMLVVGDTLRFSPDSTSMTTTTASGQTTRTSAIGGSLSVNGHPVMWIVTDVKPGAVLAADLRSDGTDALLGSLCDSLAEVGDSTRIVTTTQSAMMDSLVASGRAKGSGGSSRMLDVASRLMLSTFRALHETELGRLKTRIEGR